MTIIPKLTVYWKCRALVGKCKSQTSYMVKNSVDARQTFSSLFFSFGSFPFWNCSRIATMRRTDRPTNVGNRFSKVWISRNSNKFFSFFVGGSSGCGIIGRHQRTQAIGNIYKEHLLNVNCWKDEKKEKEAVIGQFIHKLLFVDNLRSPRALFLICSLIHKPAL